MRLRSLGYVGQNLTLGRTTGRTLRLANLDSERLAAVVAENLRALGAILDWNRGHGIRMFRIASSFVPFASHPSFSFDWRHRFGAELQGLREVVAADGVRLSMHPGQYTVLNSPRPAVVDAALAEVEYGAEVLESLVPGSGTITLHLGGAFGDPAAAKARLLTGIDRLSPLARSKLTLENDDRTFDVDDALEVAGDAGVPVVLDLFHHRLLHRRDRPEEGLEALVEAVVGTWGGRVPKLHLSSARDPTGTAHADVIEAGDLADALGLMARIGSDEPFDLMLEAKAKERAVLAAAAVVASSGPGAPSSPLPRPRMRP